MIRAVGPNVLASPEQIVRKSILLSHADRTWSVAVAGPDRLAAMINLCRDGFDHVTCARDALGAGGEDTSDVLLIAGHMSAEEITATLRHTCRLLRDGGILAVQLRRPRDDVAVRAILQSQGRTVASTLIDLTVGCLAIHEVWRAAAHRKAG